MNDASLATAAPLCMECTKRGGIKADSFLGDRAGHSICIYFDPLERWGASHVNRLHSLRSFRRLTLALRGFSLASLSPKSDTWRCL